MIQQILHSKTMVSYLIEIFMWRMILYQEWMSQHFLLCHDIAYKFHGFFFYLIMVVGKIHHESSFVHNSSFRSKTSTIKQFKTSSFQIKCLKKKWRYRFSPQALICWVAKCALQVTLLFHTTVPCFS